MKKLFVMIALATCTFANAADRVGNGGDVIVCPDRRTEVLDLFQGKEDWGLEPIVRAGTRQEIIQKTLEPFLPVDQKIAAKLLKRALEIENEISSLEQNLGPSKLVKLTINNLVNISDEGVAELPEHCEIIQAATQNRDPFPGEVKFTFQKKIWLSLDPEVQASLILHEVIYEHMISVGEYPSRSTRYFNATLHAGLLDTVKNYFKVSSLFGFRNIEIIQDGKVRKFGARGMCTVVNEWSNYGEHDYSGITIMVGRRNVLTQEKDFERAMTFFWHKYVSIGVCD